VRYYYWLNKKSFIEWIGFGGNKLWTAFLKENELQDILLRTLKIFKQIISQRPNGLF
jgi:hypothetical protein